jgi:ribosomal protein L1
MDQDHLNMEIRKFLKKVGITSQREIETAVKDALDRGKLSGGETLNARMRLQIDEVDLDLTIEGDIGLA